MKIVLFNYREDESKDIQKYSKLFDIDVEIHSEKLSLKTAKYVENADALSITSELKDEELIKRIGEYGPKYISTRSIGYDHININACNKYNIKVGNVSYSVGSVAEYTVMLILMALRNMKLILERVDSENFSLNNIQGKELKDLTVGVIGTGKIGKEVIKLLKGFNCKILAYDVYQDAEVGECASYCSKEELLANSDIITLHVPYIKETYHLINIESIKLMKNEVILINTARGPLINTYDLLKALKDKQIGYAALDVLEEEAEIYNRSVKKDLSFNDVFQKLRSYSNVMLSPHIAFFTEQAVSDMIKNSFLSCKNEYEGNYNSFRIN